MPAILGFDVAGDVVAVGPNVTGLRVGDAVFGMTNVMTGTQAEYVAVPQGEVVPKPGSLDYEAAAAVPFAALSAWQALVEAGGLQAGQRVLIHAAAGGVGSQAVQIAKTLGAYVIGTASSANLDFLRSLGADEVIDYQTTRFEDVVRDMDLVLDLVGGDTQERSWGVLKPGGMLVTLIGLPPDAEQIAAAHSARATMVATHPDAAMLRQIADLIDAGQIRPVINTVLPLAEARTGYDMSQGGHTRGKIVLRVSAD
jgi:NADPH:quinone reductase-like Zn-dependent oxidoreductase